MGGILMTDSINTEFFKRLDNNTCIKILHNLCDIRGDYDNNLNNKELEQYLFLTQWYKENFKEV